MKTSANKRYIGLFVVTLFIWIVAFVQFTNQPSDTISDQIPTAIELPSLQPTEIAVDVSEIPVVVQPLPESENVLVALAPTAIPETATLAAPSLAQEIWMSTLEPTIPFIQIEPNVIEIPVEPVPDQTINASGAEHSDNYSILTSSEINIPQAQVLPSFEWPWDGEKENGQVLWTSGPHSWSRGGELTAKISASRGNGLDFAKGGESFGVISMASGTVIRNECGYIGLGCIVAIRHDVGESIMIYAHLKTEGDHTSHSSRPTNNIEVGASYPQGQLIGEAGKTGWQDAVHLHIELRDGSGTCNVPANTDNDCGDVGFAGNPIGWDGRQLVDNYYISGYFDTFSGCAPGADCDTIFNYDGSASRGSIAAPYISFPYLDNGIPRSVMAFVHPNFIESNVCTSTVNCEINTDDTVFADHGLFRGGGGILYSTNTLVGSNELPPPPTDNPSISGGGYTISNISYPNNVNPGQTFTPQMRICVHNGLLRESQGDMLRNTDGNLYGAFPHFAIVGTVSNGQCQDVTFYQPMTAPNSDGTYNSHWQLWVNGNYIAGVEVNIQFTVGSGSSGGGGVIILHDNPDYHGEQHSYGVGRHDIGNTWNDSAHSATIPSGMSVRLFEHGNFEGQNMCFITNTPSLPGPYAEGVSSLIVYNNSGCQDDPVPPAVKLCTDDGGNTCQTYEGGLHDFSGTATNDTTRSIRVSGRSVILFREGSYRGTAECFNGDRVPLPEGNEWDLRGQVTSIHVFGQHDCPLADWVSVILNDLPNYGHYYWGMGREAGFFSVSAFGNPAYFNDQAESIRIPPSLSVILYDNDDPNNRGEASGCLTGAVSDIGSLKNRVSGIEIFNNTSCQHPDTTPPTVTILSPQEPSIFANDVITIELDASDAGTGLASVQFFAGYSDGTSAAILGLTTTGFPSLPMPAYRNSSQPGVIEIMAEGWAWHEIGWDTDGSDGWRFTWDASAVADQMIALHVYAYDQAGNYSGSTLWSVMIDRDQSDVLVEVDPFGQAVPSFSWLQPSSIVEHYQIIISDENGNEVINQWIALSDLTCNSQSVCTIKPETWLPFGLDNGTYFVTINAWYEKDGITAIHLVSQSSFTIIGRSLVDSHTGRVIVTFPDDTDLSWLQVWVGTPAPEYRTIHLAWYEKATQANCDGVICTLLTDAHPENGLYSVYVQRWDGSLSNWGGPFGFNLNFPETSLITAPAVNTDSLPPTFTWAASNAATWYQIWVGQDGGSGPWLMAHMNWYSAVVLGCSGGGTCILTPQGLSLNGGEYIWYVQAWGPGGMTTEGIAGWAEGPTFTITP